jgi:hypothetical protein
MPQKKAHYTSLMHPIESVIALSTAKMIAFLNMNQQDNDDRTFSRQSNRTSKNNRTFKSQSDHSFKV